MIDPRHEMSNSLAGATSAEDIGIAGAFTTPSEAGLDQEGSIDKNPNWIKRHMLKLSLGAFVVGTLASPIGETFDAVKTAAPWAIGAGLGSEAMWIAGAGMMVAATGKRVGNPFRLRSRWEDIKSDTADSKLFNRGLIINTVGALGTASIVAVGSVTALPPETWPGALGLAAADSLGTVAIRKGIRSGMKSKQKTGQEVEKENKRKLEEASSFKVRHASFNDIDRLADIDLVGFSGAYGEKAPDKQTIVDEFTQRLANNPGWMFVVEVDKKVEGFVTAFRTNKPIEDFVSWEASTANGTLNGVVDPKGKYVYVVNLTMNPEATKVGGYDSAIANLFANSIRDGVEYGYFVSRMPKFGEWVNAKVNSGELSKDMDPEQLYAAADQYFNLKRPTKEGEVRHDPQLRMYENSGFKLERLVPNAFEDEASLNFGVVCKANIPPKNKLLKSIRPARLVLASSLRLIAKKPKILQKVL